MTSTVAAIWRYPIKSHGREAVESVTLAAGQAMPWDRRWAVVHDAATPPEPGQWVPCPTFQRGARLPALAAMTARLDESEARVDLAHPALGSLTVRPDLPEEAAMLLYWLSPLCEPSAAQPAGIHALPERGLTDSDFASVSVLSTSSHAAVEAHLGHPLEPERWRGNFWLDGLEPWAEEGWAGRRIRIGGAMLEGVEPIRRCRHTEASPRTGLRDVDTLGALDGAHGSQYFGLNARVIEGGPVRLGDPAEPI